MPSFGASLTQTLAQKTVLSQQMRQSVELLQLSGPELQREVEEQLEANPLLRLKEADAASIQGEASVEVVEGSEDAPEAGVARDYREPNYLSWRQTAPETEDFDPFSTISLEESLTDYLLRQLGCKQAAQPIKKLGEWIIGNLDERGFLTDPPLELVSDFERASGLTVSPADWRTALALVQSLDPAGIAAAGPTESLLIQIARSGADPRIAQTAAALLQKLPTELARRDYKTAARTLDVTEEVVKKAHELILSLTPHPAAAFGDTHEAGCVIAEVLLVHEKGAWRAVLNPAVVYRLQFDEETYALLTQAKLKEQDLTEWKNRAREAKGFMRSLEMRYSTITAVAQTIVDFQQAFFTEGARALKPMSLKDIAGRLNLSESTISRAAAGKYLQSPAGTFELRHFFSSALTGDDGQNASAAAARRLIVEAVAAEDPAKPLSDAAIADILAGKGIHLARRTVAKYREIEKIPPKSLRRRIC